MSAYAEAMLDAGLVQCAACGTYDAPRKMAINVDGSEWLCATAATGLATCADSDHPCIDCLQPVPRRDLDMDGGCGCVADAAESLERVQVMAARQTARAA